MKRALTLLVLLAFAGAAWAAVPDPDYCVVNPMDNMSVPRVIGIPEDIDDPLLTSHVLDIHVAAFGGDDIEDAFVEVIVSPLCELVCECDAVVYTGYTNSQGDVQITIKAGGCCEMPGESAVVIMAEGVAIRGAEYFVSPDYDGATGNCQVILGDFIYFGPFFGTPAGSGVTCADYSGDEGCTLPDFIVFGGGFGRTCPGN